MRHVEVALVWIFLIIGATIVLTTMFATGRKRSLDQLTPKELLDRRYAAGEINEAEYLTHLSILKDANELTR